MFNFGDLRDYGMNPLGLVAAATSSATKGWQAITAETMDYSTKFMEAGRAYGERMLSVRNPDEFIEVQSSFAKAAYEDFIRRTTKMNKLYSDLATETLQNVTKEVSNGARGAERAAKGAHEASKGAIDAATKQGPKTER